MDIHGKDGAVKCLKLKFQFFFDYDVQTDDCGCVSKDFLEGFATAVAKQASEIVQQHIEETCTDDMPVSLFATSHGYTCKVDKPTNLKPVPPEVA